MDDTDAAELVGYAVPRQMAYQNRRSLLLQRYNAANLEKARQLLLENPGVDPTTHPLGPWLALLKGLNAERPYTNAGNGPDNMARMKAADKVLAILGLDTSVEAAREARVQVNVQTSQKGSVLVSVLEASEEDEEAMLRAYQEAQRRLLRGEKEDRKAIPPPEETLEGEFEEVETDGREDVCINGEAEGVPLQGVEGPVGTIPL
jgi:hypothetical protein